MLFFLNLCGDTSASDDSAEFVIKSYMKILSDYFASKEGKTYRFDQGCNDVVYGALLTIGIDVPAIKALNAGMARQEIGRAYHNEVKPIIAGIKQIAKSDEVKQTVKSVKSLFKKFRF